MSGKKILVADDSLTIQKVIRLALSHDEYEIQAVSDGNDALQQIALFRPQGILIDISLPGKTAFEVKQSINQQEDAKNFKFILMSSAFEKYDENLAKEVGFDGHLTKPFDPAQLRQVLSQVLGKQNPIKVEESIVIEDPSLNEKDPFPNLSPPPFTPPFSGSPYTGEIDIKQLTEETLQLSNPEELEWSIQESSSKSKTPSSIPDFEPTLTPSINMVDLEDVSFQIDLPKSNHKTPLPLDLPLTPPPIAPPPQTEPNVLPLSTGQMEALLKKQLQDTLEKMVREILPAVAEKVIKQEIHKLLEEHQG